MNFLDLYKSKQPAFSFEIFPPKDSQTEQALFEALKDLKPFHPAFISVTYGAMGTTQDRTRDLAIQIQKELGLTTAFHFTCVGSDRKSIRDYVETLKNEGLNLIVALRGDPPQGADKFSPPADGFSHANELVTYLRTLGGFSMAVAGYPEGHIESVDKETDLKNLVRKVNAGADVVITQLFFDNKDYFDFVDRARQAGVKAPIIPGIMPIVSFKQIEKITKMCGAVLPRPLYQELSQAEGDEAKEIGIRHATQQCRELLDRGAPGIHFYTLNKSESTRRVLEGIGYGP